MNRIKLNVLFALLLIGSNVHAADPLPRVLILGDRLSQGLQGAVANELKGRAQVVWVDSADTSYALANLDTLLGKEKWNVIHFNFGISDLCYKDPSIKGIRAMSKSVGGVRVTQPDLFRKNLIELVRRLNETGAKLIWASSPPPVIPGVTANYDPGSEIEYNTIAAQVMAEKKIPVNDQYALAVESAKEKKKPLFHEPTVKAILSELGLLKK